VLRVAVVTPYYRETLAILHHCQLSVAKQTYPCFHVMVADGSSNPAVDDWAVDHIRLPKSYADVGSTPRLIGCYHAIGLGADAVAFLDADNWYRDDHIENLVNLHIKTSAAFLSSGRMLCRLDGSIMTVCPYTNPEKFIDTSCMMFAREAFHILSNWTLMPSYAHIIGDRVMLHYVKAAAVRRAHSDETSVYYRCGKDGVYRDLGEPIPTGVSPKPNYDDANARWIADGYPGLT
jgi:hypothetical protein